VRVSTRYNPANLRPRRSSVKVSTPAVGERLESL
jgi:hypothetical protein